MGSMSIAHWAIVLAWLAVIGIPVGMILKRIGFSGWWSVLAFVPIAKLVGLWVLAFGRWPIRPLGTNPSEAPL